MSPGNLCMYKKKEGSMNILLNKQLQSDETFKQVYENYFPYIYKLAFKRLQCYDTAVDIAQEVFTLYLEKMDTVKNPRSWLAQVASFKVINHFRFNKKYEDINNFITSSHCSANKCEAKVILDKAIRITGLKKIEVYILEESILQKKYFTVIADELNATRRQVEYIYKQSIKKLQDYFKSIGIKSMQEIL